MKKPLLFKALLSLFSIGFVPGLFAQIHIVPDIPSPVYNYNYPSGQPYFGYSGHPILYNSKLYIAYQPISSDGVTAGSVPFQIAQYDGTDVLKIIKNPDAGGGYPGGGYQINIPPIVYNNKLYFSYLDVNKVFRLAQFDGTSLTLIANPDAGTLSGYDNYPVIFNNKLYIQYANSSGVSQLAQFDGTSLTLIPNPDASPIGYEGNPIVFNNKLYLKYSNNVNGSWQLGQYDGTNFTLIPSPDASSHGYQGNPIVFNNKLYMMYDNFYNKNQLMVYDGSSSPTLITNPDVGYGFVGLPIIYNNNLYIQYQNGSGVYQLAKYDGTSFTLIPNPDASTYGYWNTPIIYNNKLCIFYRNAAGVHQLAVYDGTSYKLVANPDASANGYWDQPIVYGANLYFQYYDVSNTLQLAYYDGSTIKIIPIATKFYGGNPILFNNLLYLQVVGTGAVPDSANIANLAYFNESVLPVSLVHFTAQRQNTDVLLNWQTSSEENNKGFEVYRSIDGINFSQIGFVSGAGNSSVLLNYSYTDETELSGKIYYRLKQIDIDGNGKYSPIVYVNGSNDYAVSFYPNPVQTSITLQSSQIVKEIDLVNTTGQIIKKWNNVSPNSQLDVSNIASGTYFLHFINNDFVQTQKLVKK